MDDASVFSIDGIQFVSGLFWQPLSESNSGDKQKEIKSLAKELTFDLYVVRNTPFDCVGFANPKGEVKHGQVSAAAVVSKALELELKADNFIFVTHLPDGRWLYVAQRDGQILPDGDLIFNSEDGAKTRLLEDFSAGDWALVIAPEIWSVRKSSERSFESLLPRDKKGRIEIHKWWRLTNVDSSKELARHKGKLILVVVLLAMAGAGFKFYQDYKTKKEMEAAAIAAQQMIDAQGNAIPIEHPWKTIPVANDVLEACMNAVSSVTLFPGNWDLVAANCSNGLLTVTWKPQEKGWIEHLKTIHPNAVISTDGSVASINVPLGDLKTGVDEVVSEENQRLIEMYSAAQRFGFKFTISQGQAPAPALPGQEGVVPPPPDWKEINWKADGITLPESVLAGLGGNGFRMKVMNATWQNGQFIWTMEGTQYVKQ